MFVTTVIPTIGRSSLERAVDSVLNQECAADSEIVVVNDSGKPLTEAKWQRSPRVRIANTFRRERGAARNTGAALATGDYLHFLDDDDWLLPGALQVLSRLAEQSRGSWLYGGSQLVDRRGNKLIELHHDLTGNCALQVMSGEWIPVQSSLFKSSFFFALGGFNSLIPGAEDIDLTRRAALHADIAGTRDLVACIGMGTEGSSTDYARSREFLRPHRETVLDQQRAFTRLRAGAGTAYWSGRLLRIYSTSALWNIRQRRFATAASRFSYSIAALVLAGLDVSRATFWSGLTKPYRNDTFQRGFLEAGLDYAA